jgi:hypothetical protein
MTCLHPAVVFASDAYLKLYTAVTVVAFTWKGAPSSIVTHVTLLMMIRVSCYAVCRLLLTV